MPPQSLVPAPEFARLDQAVTEFRQVRAELGITGVSWIMADRQLETLLPRFPERARQILDAIDRERGADNDPDAPQPICPSCMHTACSGDCSSCGTCKRTGPIRMST
jgi:hypothetical protein